MLFSSERFILTLSIPELTHHVLVQSWIFDHIFEGVLLNDWLGWNRNSLVDQFQCLWKFREFSGNVESLRIEVFMSFSKEHVRDAILVLTFDVIGSLDQILIVTVVSVGPEHVCQLLLVEEF